ncbi:MAG: glycosyl transferase family 2 protein [Microgenomates group bacterium Gr01-1014_5]|nr:MAG: glycosyl transferase family 2 protein [Microgenomates group bacterium Gr01-1014_5]
MKKSSQNLKVEVSVIIVNYNTGNFLKKCVDSIVKSTNNLRNPVCEIIIVDNASNDQSANFKGSFKLIKNADNPGFSRANNQAIKISQGNYILLLNPDTEIKGGTVSKLLQFAKIHKNAGVVVPKLLNSDGTVQDSVMPLPTLYRAISEFWFNKKIYSRYVPRVVLPTVIESAIMAAFLITPQTLQKVGLLDERYFMYFEDLDYCRRVKKTDLEVYYLPTALVVHHQGVSGKSVAGEQWRRLIPGSKIYHGLFGHWLINFVIWISQKLK